MGGIEAIDFQSDQSYDVRWACMTADDRLRVVVLHNHDNSWDEADIQESIDELRGMTTALEAHGCQVRTAQVHHSVRAVLDTGDCDPRQVAGL